MMNNETRVLRALCGVAWLAVLAACGGGGQDSPTVRESGQARGGSVSWAPQSVAFSVNPAARQDIPVTLTATLALSGASITVVPELRGIVTVSPTSIGSLQAGQSATITLTVAPGASESLRPVEGAIRVVSGASTIAKPLPVRIALVAPELINGATVPPEPPADLNNATLTGFDTNGNGVRDDVERLIAREFGQSAALHAEVMAFSKAELAAIVSPTSESVAAFVNLVACSKVTASQLDKATYAQLNTTVRRNAYASAFAGATGEECQ